MGKLKEFLKRKDVVFSAHRYGIDAIAMRREHNVLALQKFLKLSHTLAPLRYLSALYRRSCHVSRHKS